MGSNIFLLFGKQATISESCQAPTADVVPVVRCGECAKQFMPDCPLQIIEKHEQRFICQNENDFCSYGKKDGGRAMRLIDADALGGICKNR